MSAREINTTSRREKILAGMLLRLMTGEPIAERKQMAFWEWFAEERDEVFKWSIFDSLFSGCRRATSENKK